MLKSLQILLFILILTVLGYLYRVELKERTIYYYITLSQKNIFNTVKSELTLSQEDDETSLNSIDNLLDAPIKGTTIESSSALLFALITSETVNIEQTTNIPSYSLNLFNVLNASNGIIFLETTDNMQPSSLVLCAIESAARVYKDRPVVYLMKGLNDTKSRDTAKKYFPMLSSLKNIYFLPLRMEDVFAETPLMSWYQKVDPTKEKHWTHVSADGCRLAVIWKYGGIYLDTDVISIQQIPHQLFLAARVGEGSSNGVFGFSPHHAYTWKCMEDFVQNYRGAVWAHQGPMLFTRILKQSCTLPLVNGENDIMCGNITFMSRLRFYPIPFPEWRQYYRVWSKPPTFNASYGLHLWNYMNRGKKTMVLGSNTLVEHLYQQHCPSTYDHLAET